MSLMWIRHKSMGKVIKKQFRTYLKLPIAFLRCDLFHGEWYNYNLVSFFVVVDKLEFKFLLLLLFKNLNGTNIRSSITIEIIWGETI